MDKGIKYDSQKERWDLLPMAPVTEVVKVLTAGSVKYSDDNWKKVPDRRRRYYSAAMRHITAWWMGEKCDGETGLHHLAHAICCLIFIMWED